jgi:2-polyprenyl-3-methyl-5-hydroxy-6-metoxy-1,4-benzoquinol methylase
METNLDEYASAYSGDIMYDFDNEIMLKWYSNRVLSLSKGAQSLLELGLGHGHTTDLLSGNFSRHLVLDGSAKVIENFRTKYPACDVEIEETYFENFDSNEKFDVILLGFILEHVDDPVAIMSRFSQFLSPGGKMFMSVPNAECMNRRLGKLAGILDDVKTLSANDHLLGHKRFYTVNTLKQDIEKANYTVDRLEGIYLKPLTTAQMISLELSREILDSLCLLGVDYPELCCGLLAEVSAR